MERVERVVAAGDMMILGGGGGGRSTGGARSKSEHGAKESHDSYFKLSSVRKKYTKVDKY